MKAAGCELAAFSVGVVADVDEKWNLSGFLFMERLACT